MLFSFYNTLVPWTCILQLPVYAEHSNIVYFENSTKNSCNILFKIMTHWKTTAAKVVRDKKRKALNLSVNVFSTKVIIGDTIFTSTTALLRGHASEPRKGLAICSRAKVIPSFLSHFKILSIGPTPGIELLTSHSAVKHFTKILPRLRLGLHKIVVQWNIDMGSCNINNNRTRHW